MYLFSFEKLEVWKLSRELVKRIYSLTSKFPVEEKFGLVSQIRRSAVSVSSNLAEGTSRSTNKDKAHFTLMAYSSLMELLNHLILALDLGFISNHDYTSFRIEIEKIANMLNSLKKAQLRRLD